jgi:hypothetical protein
MGDADAAKTVGLKVVIHDRPFRWASAVVKSKLVQVEESGD